MAAALAGTTDVEATLGRALTSTELTRAAPILEKASELFRREARRTFTAASPVVRLRVTGTRTGGVVYLPERPIETINSVVDDDGNAVSHTLRQQRLILTGCYGFVTVDYTHGTQIPDLVRLTIAEIAATVLSIPTDAVSGVAGSTETKGPFTRTLTYAKWAQGGKTMLAPDDTAIAQSFRPAVPRMFVQDAGPGPGLHSSQMSGID